MHLWGKSALCTFVAGKRHDQLQRWMACGLLLVMTHCIRHCTGLGVMILHRDLCGRTGNEGSCACRRQWCWLCPCCASSCYTSTVLAHAWIKHLTSKHIGAASCSGPVEYWTRTYLFQHSLATVYFHCKHTSGMLVHVGVVVKQLQGHGSCFDICTTDVLLHCIPVAVGRLFCDVCSTFLSPAGTDNSPTLLSTGLGLFHLYTTSCCSLFWRRVFDRLHLAKRLTGGLLLFKHFCRSHRA